MSRKPSPSRHRDNFTIWASDEAWHYHIIIWKCRVILLSYNRCCHVVGQVGASKWNGKGKSWYVIWITFFEIIVMTKFDFLKAVFSESQTARGSSSSLDIAVWKFFRIFVPTFRRIYHHIGRVKRKCPAPCCGRFHRVLYIKRLSMEIWTVYWLLNGMCLTFSVWNK